MAVQVLCWGPASCVEQRKMPAQPSHEGTCHLPGCTVLRSHYDAGQQRPQHLSSSCLSMGMRTRLGSHLIGVTYSGGIRKDVPTSSM